MNAASRTSAKRAGWQKAWIGMGANLGDPVAQLNLALATLNAHPSIVVDQVSSLYASAPVGYADQPDFFNAVCGVWTCLDAHQLLTSMLKSESAIGRVRKGPRNGPRMVDLDLLMYGALSIQTERLILPHPRMAERRFVLDPLIELDPDIVIPGFGGAASLLRHCQDQPVHRIQTSPRSSTCTEAARQSERVENWPGPGAFDGTLTGEK